MSHIFISYSHKDNEYAHKLAESLEKENFSVWIDNRIDYGSRWPHVIQEQLDSCGAFIVIMSPRSYASEWVQNELSRAQAKHKKIFSLLLEGEVWLAVQATQYIDVRDGNLPPENFYRQLNGAVPSRTEGTSSKETKSETPQPTLVLGKTRRWLQTPFTGFIAGFILGLFGYQQSVIENPTFAASLTVAGFFGLIGWLLGKWIKRLGPTNSAKNGAIVGLGFALTIGLAVALSYGKSFIYFIYAMYVYILFFGLIGWSIGRSLSRKN